MSAFKTYGFISGFVQQKLDLQEEIFITNDELLSYYEEAARFCEAEIHKLNIEDQYFVAVAPIMLEVNKSEYALPSGMYANKILRIVYNVDSKLYDIPRIRVERRFEIGALMDQYQPSDNYGYMLINNDVRSGTKMRLYPKSRDASLSVVFTGTTTLGSGILTGVSSVAGLVAGYFITGTGIPNGTRIQTVGTTTVTMTQEALATGSVSVTAKEPRVLCWHIRSVVIPTSPTDLVDFPEFWNFIAQYMIVQCLMKEIGNPRITGEAARLTEIKDQMLSTLSNMVPDQDDILEKDVSSFEDQGLQEGSY